MFDLLQEKPAEFDFKVGRPDTNASPILYAGIVLTARYFLFAARLSCAQGFAVDSVGQCAPH